MNFKNFKQFIKNPLLSALFGISILINLLNFIVLFFFVKDLKKSIILHYNVYRGVDFFGDSFYVFLMTLVGTFFLAINLFLAYYFFSKKERMLSHVLSLTALITPLGLTVSSTSIIIVNYL